MSTTIEINDNIQIVTITVVDEDNTVTLQPVVTRNGGNGFDGIVNGGTP